jgi:hypothetical protein
MSTLSVRNIKELTDFRMLILQILIQLRSNLDYKWESNLIRVY